MPTVARERDPVHISIALDLPNLTKQDNSSVASSNTRELDQLLHKRSTTSQSESTDVDRPHPPSISKETRRQPMPAQPDRAHRQFQVINLLARLTADPVLRSSNGPTQVVSLRLAVQRPRRNGEDQGADYVDVVVFGRQAETCAQYLTKGRKVAVNGRLAHSEWTAEDGSRRQKLEVTANTIDFLDRPANADSEPEVVEAAA